MIRQVFAGLALLFSCGQILADAPPQAATCIACHGQRGVSVNPEWPSLAGQKQGYLVAQITAFRDGERVNPQMAPMVKSLSDKDVAALAAYFSAQAPATAANGDTGIVAQGQNRAAYCVSCHGMRGITANEEWPNLAGQQALYLENQLRAFKRGERKNGLMQTVIAGFSDHDLPALAAYFSQLERE